MQEFQEILIGWIQEWIVTIEEMKNICEHCGTKMWPTESPDLYCLGDKNQCTSNSRFSRIAQEPIIAEYSSSKIPQKKASEIQFFFFFFWADKNMTDFGFLTTYKIQGRIIIWWVLLVHNPKNPINWCRYTVGSKSI